MRRYCRYISVFIMIIGLLFICGCSKKYTITYQTDGGIFSDGSSSYVVECKKGETLVLPASPTKEGYTFLGWYSNTTNSIITIGVVVESNMTLTAKWEKEVMPTIYTVLYDSNGGVFANGAIDRIDYYEEGETLALPTSPTKEGYTFLGWYNKMTNELLSNGFIVNSDLQIIAKWEKEKEEFEVTYHLDGGVFSDGSTTKSETYESGSYLHLLEEPTKEGSKFLGWFNVSTGELLSNDVVVNENLQIIAKWEVTEYKVTYKSKSGKFEDGSTLKEVMVKKGNRIPYDIYPIIQDRVFSGWYDDETDELIYPGTLVTSNMTVYAKYKRVDVTSNIVYHTNSGVTDVPFDDLYYEGILVAFPVLVKEGFQFLGWYDNAELIGEPMFYQDADATGDKEYWASWELVDINYIDVIFAELIPDVVDNDLNFAVYYCNTTIYWETSDYSLINAKGIVTQTHNDEIVNIKATITFNNQVVVKEKEITLQAVKFKTLDRPVAGYFYVTGVTYMTDAVLESLDMAYYAFANVRSNGDVIVENASQLNKFIQDAKTLKQHGIRIILSIAGGADNFSTACRVKGSSYVAQNIVDLVVKYGFDGVDIDWEFPADASDMQRMNTLCQSLRIKLDSLVREGGTPYILSAAIPSSEIYSKFDLNTLNNYLDYVNMMSYDMNAAGLTTHLCPLLKANNDGNKGYGVDAGIEYFTNAGLDKDKIIIGSAFYGKSYSVLGTTLNPKYPGLGVRAELLGMQYASGTITYSYIVNNILPNRNYVRYWDEKAKASYLYNEVDQIFITFEDEESLIEKTTYAYENGVGIMFWEYGYDYQNVLTDTICNTMYALKNANE